MWVVSETIQVASKTNVGGFQNKLDRGRVKAQSLLVHAEFFVSRFLSDNLRELRERTALQ